MTETTGLPWASRNPGRMHACGHDGHTATLLAAAQLLAVTRAFNGTLHLIFQPAEEGLQGGRKMVDEGLFERFPCDAIFAYHNEPGFPAGRFGFLPGVIYSSSDTVVITRAGQGRPWRDAAHHGRPDRRGGPPDPGLADPGLARGRPERHGGGHRRQPAQRRRRPT